MNVKFKDSDRAAIALAGGLFLLNVITPGYMKFFLLSDSVAGARNFVSATFFSKPKTVKKSSSTPLCDSDFARMVERATQQGSCKL